ncbi:MULTISPECIES: methyltransferase domain-containing protein [Halococcus]|uniref:tRNA methyltransferase complex GCD14 subunit n=1 Tax=Halococcus salifodinae DSM 8989 TaxID=1227456 RepID=M0MXB1_9EURY|nr:MULTISPECIES: methyltransferase domain-containing protein [Halococcus]EMA49045.1 tRNA methyltransferase complex GCD14 subunit [Halococcus salifodinae DSM 8989]
MTAVLLVTDDREYLREPGETLETDLGVLDVPDDVEPGEALETHLGTEFRVRELRGPDLFNHFDRTGAPMMPRDIGLIAGHTGVATGDCVLDAGTGTGVLAAYLARAGASVVTYEQDPEFADVARENMALAGVAGAESEDEAESTPEPGSAAVRAGDVLDELDDLSGFDLVTLDTADAPAVVEHAPELLVPGGFLAVYSPFVEDSRAVVESAREAGLAVETYETIQREMDFDERGTRPSTAGVGHTGYLVFGRN